MDLQRLTMGTLALDENLEQGEWRRLTKEELEDLHAVLLSLDYVRKGEENVLAFLSFCCFLCEKSYNRL